jgi:hypothetical protein
MGALAPAQAAVNEHKRLGHVGEELPVGGGYYQRAAPATGSGQATRRAANSGPSPTAGDHSPPAISSDSRRRCGPLRPAATTRRAPINDTE